MNVIVNPTFQYHDLELEQRPPPHETQPAHVADMISSAKRQADAGYSPKHYRVIGFDADNSLLADIKAGATSWRALDIIYNFERVHQAKATPNECWWIGDMANAQAVRNRCKISSRLLKKLLLQRRRETGRGTEAEPLQILSLAAGSAQTVLEGVADLRETHGVHSEVILIDADADVRELLMQRIVQLDLTGTVHFYAASAFRFPRIVKGQQFDVIEMLGLLDYLNEETASKLFKMIQRALRPGGRFITCHIHDNPEVEFMRRVINWGVDPHMFYREPDELHDLLASNGFNVVELITEPWQIHSVAVCVNE